MLTYTRSKVIQVGSAAWCSRMMNLVWHLARMTRTVRIWDDGKKLICKAVENTKRLIGGHVVT